MQSPVAIGHNRLDQDHEHLHDKNVAGRKVQLIRRNPLIAKSENKFSNVDFEVGLFQKHDIGTEPI